MGGITLNDFVDSENSKYVMLSPFSGNGFYCEDGDSLSQVQTPPYQIPYNAKLTIQDCIRQPSVSHFFGPYRVADTKITGNSYAVIFFGIQYAQMKYRYGPVFNYTDDQNNFISAMYNSQRESAFPLFRYIQQSYVASKELMTVGAPVVLPIQGPPQSSPDPADPSYKLYFIQTNIGGYRNGTITNVVTDPNGDVTVTVVENDGSTFTAGWASLQFDSESYDCFSADYLLKGVIGTEPAPRIDATSTVPIGLNPGGLGLPDWTSQGWVTIRV